MTRQKKIAKAIFEEQQRITSEALGLGDRVLVPWEDLPVNLRDRWTESVRRVKEKGLIK